MRQASLGAILILSCTVLVFGQDWLESELGSNGKNGFDLDLFKIGSNLRSLGKPKFKISQHLDGYSVHIGYGDNRYVRFRYADSAQSIDFNILKHKGSFKFKDNRWRRNNGVSDDITVDGEISEKDPCLSCFLDGKLKMKVLTGSRRSGDPLVLDLSIINTARVREYIWLPTAIIRDIDNIEMLLKIVITPDNPVNSVADFQLNIRAKEMRSENSFSNEYLPGHYNLTASLKVTQFNIESGERQPRFKAKLDIAEKKRFDAVTILEPMLDTEEMFRGNRDNFKRSFNLDGMINLTGEGKRLAVVKLTDAETDRVIGRVQARFSNEENLRVELFGNDDQLGAINWHTTQTSSNLTIETNVYCQDLSSKDETEGYDQYESNGYESNIIESYYNVTNTTIDPTNGDNVEGKNVPRNILPTLSDLFGWNIKAPEKENCNINRLLETEFDNERVTTRVYQDVLHMFSAPHYRKEMRARGKVFEENIVLKNDGYHYNTTISDGYEGRAFSGIVQNNTQTTDIKVTTAAVFDGIPLFTSLHPDASLDMEINEIDTENHNFKIQWNNERLFDGWFYQAKMISKVANDQIPIYLKKYFEMGLGREFIFNSKPF